MKRKFLNIVSCFLALFIFVSSFFFFVPSCVSASVDVSSLPSVFFDPSVSQSSYQECIDALKLNDSISDLGDCYILINRSSQVEIMIFKDFSDSFNILDSYYGQNAEYFVPSKFGFFTVSFSNLSSFIFSLDSVSLPSPSNINQYSPRCLGVYNESFPYIPVILDSNHDIRDRNPNYHCFYSSVTPPYQDDYLTGFVTGFDYSTEAFVQWLIDTGKYQDLPAYIGTSKLVSFVDFYKQWGSSNKLFVVKILEWMAHFNIGSQSLENRNILKSTIDRLYQDYCNSSYVTFKSNSANNVHHRQNINTKTDDTDLTLVTDDPNDDTITSILRDILRGVIAIPTSIYNNSQAIISKLDSLNWTVNIANDGGSSSGSDLTPVLNKMDDIIDKLEADTVSVEIDQTTKDDTDDFFDNWNLEFSTALNNKFPVAGQLSTLFTDFWEKCGVDADGDGETFEYYNPGVFTSSFSRSGSAGVSESDIVSDFLGNFDDADPAFLDNASFHGVPDLSVTVGGRSVSIIDFRVYAKYREKIHFIISFVIWTFYLLHLYKALPSIIGQVADVAVKSSDL